MRWVIYVSLLVLLVSCSPHVEKERGQKQPRTEKIVTRDDAATEIACFRCHSYERFSSQGKGVFPHVLHRDAGYHCNQCHTFKGHHPVEIHTEVCKNCHNLQVFSFSSSEFPVKFNHEFHAKLGCKECHLGIFPMKKGSTHITMDALYRGMYCGKCHDGKQAFTSTECARCHDMKNFNKDLRYKVEGVGDVVFSHKFHTAMFTCNDCHTKFFIMKKSNGKMTMDEMNKGKFCGGCHNGTAASPVSDCGKCHKA